MDKKTKHREASQHSSSSLYSSITALRNEPLREKNYFSSLEHEGLFNSAPKDVLGLTEGQINSLYNEAIHYLALHEIPQAVKGFQLLCSLCPYDADFWMGYAAALREDGNLPQTLSALLMVETIDPDRFDLYPEAIHTCLEMNNVKEAHEILKRCKKRHNTLTSDDELLNIPYEIELLEEEIDKAERHS